MEIEIRPNVIAAGLEDPVRRVSDGFERITRKQAQPRKATWDMVSDSSGTRLVLLALVGEGGASVRDVYSPAELNDLFHMRERFDVLLSRYLSRRLSDQLDEWAEAADRQPVASE